MAPKLVVHADPVRSASHRLGARTSTPVRVLGWLGAALAVWIVLFMVYDRLSAAVSPDADSANAVLQGQSIARGNLLLHGWVLSSASFYLTDLPVYALTAAVRGLSAAAAHDAGAAIYALLVVTACLLAGAGAHGRQRLGRMAVTFVFLVAPAAGLASALVLLGPYHAGTTVVILLALLALNASQPEGEARHPWLGLTGFTALLAAAVLSDALTLYVAVVPVLLVVGLRLVRRSTTPRREWTLLGAAVAAVLGALAAGRLIEAAGGFATVPLAGAFAGIGDLPNNGDLLLHGVLVLFGADALTQPLTELPHLAGLAFAVACCVWVAVEWWRGRELDRVTQVLAVGIAVNLAAYAVSNQAVDLRTTRYLVPALAFTAVLAGRYGAGWLAPGWRRWLAAGIGLAYTASFVAALAAPAPRPSPSAEVGAFLVAHNLHHGLARYWQASTVTLETGGRVEVRAIDYGPGRLRPYRWEVDTSWYRREATDASWFVLLDTTDTRSLSRSAVEATFGVPVVTYRTGRWVVLVWDHNLLSDLA